MSNSAQIAAMATATHAPPSACANGERGDIIKRMYRALGERGIDRGSASFVLAGESIDEPVIGRLVARFDRGPDRLRADHVIGVIERYISGAD